MNSQLTLNDYEEIIGSVKSDPTQWTVVMTQSKSSSETDHEASVSEAVDSFRQPMLNACRMDNSGESGEGMAKLTEDSSRKSHQDLLSQ